MRLMYWLDADPPDYSWERIERFNVKELEKECVNLAQQLEKMNPQTAALDEYRKRQAEYKEHLGELEGVLEEKRKACIFLHNSLAGAIVEATTWVVVVICLITWNTVSFGSARQSHQ